MKLKPFTSLDELDTSKTYLIYAYYLDGAIEYSGFDRLVYSRDYGAWRVWLGGNNGFHWHNAEVCRLGNFVFEL